MATTVRGGGSGSGSGSGRERRGTSPSTSPLVNKSPKPSLTTPTSSSSSRDRKQVSNPNPSYLRATKNSKSTSLDPSPVSRRLSESSAQKPAPSRRRSLDRPLPVPQGPPMAKETKHLRSSSMSTGRTRIAPGATQAPKTSIRERKADVPQLFKSMSLNRGTLASKPAPNPNPNPKMTSSTSRLGIGLKKKTSPKSLTSESSNENCELIIEPLVSDDDMAYTHHLENHSLPEISEMPNSNEELRDPTNLEVVGEKECQMDIVVHVDEHEDEQQEEETHEDKPMVDVQEVPHQENIVDEEPSHDDDDHHHQVEVKSVEQGDQIEESAGDLDEVDPTDTCPKEAEDEAEAEEEKLDTKEEEKNVEVEKQSVVVVCSSPQAVDGAPEKVQSAGRRENQDYNDVIEQTASRLMGKKNKVLALAGAFETVISYANKN